MRFPLTARILAGVFFLAFIQISAAQQQSVTPPTAFWPEGVEWDPTLPTPEAFLGFEIGHRHLSHAQVAAYARKIAEISDRVSIEQYATSHGGRPLLLLTITSPENRDRLNQIRKSHRQLSKRGADRVATEDLPAVINMGYGVHGDEPSATNCSPLVIHYLAAARGAEIERILQKCVILLDPSLNPDGFNRFANWVNRYRGRALNPDPQHAEHNQDWPPGRVNYYWFDLNRDWLPLVHPESQGRMNWYHKWKPNVVLDFHEMGTNSTFFFQPGIPERTNPLTPAGNVELTRKFANYHGKALDQRGSLYFTQERFDDFYMGKGSTYPDLHGSVGILFEQASSRGHVQKNQDGLLRFSDTIANQFTTSLSSLRATADLRKELLEYKKSFYKESVEIARRHAVKTFVFSAPYNRTRVTALAKVLKKHDIECYWLRENLDYGDRRFDRRWSLVVPVEQPEFRFLKSLLMRRTNFRENIFYDVSSWTLSLAYGVNQAGLKRSLNPELLEPFKFKSTAIEPELDANDEVVAYVIDCREDEAINLLRKMLANGLNVRLARKEFTTTASSGTEKTFPAGSLLVALGVQKVKLSKIVSLLKEGMQRGVPVQPVYSGLSTLGPDLGSNNFKVLTNPKIAMLSGAGVSTYGAGEIWHLLDHQYRLPVTMLKRSRFGSAELTDYSSLILPGLRVADNEWTRISEYVAGGGTIIAFGGSATDVAKRLGKLSNPDVPLPAVEREVQEPFSSASKERALNLISGAIFKTRTDLTHPLLYGFTRNQLAVFRTNTGILSPSENEYCNPIVYDSENPLMAGYCSDENIQRLKGSASLVVHPVGRGRFILMAERPNFRGFWKATGRVFLNAIFWGNIVDP